MEFKVEVNKKDNILLVNINRSFSDDAYTHVIYRLYRNGAGYSHYQYDKIQNDYTFTLREDGLYFVRVSVYQGEKKYEYNSVTYEHFSQESYDKLDSYLSDKKVPQRSAIAFCPSNKANDMYNDYVVVSGNRTKITLNGFRKYMLSDDLTLYSNASRTFGNVLFSGQASVKGVYLDGESDKTLIEKYVGELHDATGCYTLIHKKDNKLTINVDYFGLNKIYYYQSKTDDTFVFSNRYHLLLIAMKELGIKSQLDTDIALSYLAVVDMPTAQFISEKMMVENTYLLPLYKSVCISKGIVSFPDTSFVENFKEQEYSEERYVSLVNEAVKEMQDNLNSVFESGKFDTYISDLTGGMDSRMLFSLLSKVPNAKGKVNLRTFGDISEKRVAYTLANSYRFKYNTTLSSIVKNFYELNPLNKNEFLDYQKSYYLGVDFECTGTKELPYTIAKNVIKLTGAAGEHVSRPYIVGHLFPKNAGNNNSVTDVVYDYLCNNTVRTYFGYNNSVVKNFEKLFADALYNSDYTDPKQKYEFYYLKNRTRQHFDLSMHTSSLIVMWTPLLSKASYKAAQMSIKQHSFRKYIYDLLYAINPEIAVYEYLEKANNTERLEHAAELLCKDPKYKTELRAATDEKPEYVSDSPITINYHPSDDWKEATVESCVYERFIEEFVLFMKNMPELKESIGMPLYNFINTYDTNEKLRPKMEKHIISLYRVLSSINEVLFYI